jgi:hypothetical protein
LARPNLMDHLYIDDNSVAERYLEHRLPPQERAAFEVHFVDCQECRDRLLLAEMFQARNGAMPKQEPPPVSKAEVPLRARFVAQFKPWQLVVMFVAAALLLLAIPTAYFFWVLERVNALR